MIDELVKQIDYMERVFYDAYLRCHYMKEGLKQIPGQYQAAPPMVQTQGTQQMNPEPTLQTQQTPLTVQPPPQMQQAPPQMQQAPPQMQQTPLTVQPPPQMQQAPPQGTPPVQQQTEVNTAPKYGFRTADELRHITPNDEWFRLVSKSDILFGVTPESPDEQRELGLVYNRGIEGIGTFNRNGKSYHFSQRMIKKIS